MPVRAALRIGSRTAARVVAVKLREAFQRYFQKVGKLARRGKKKRGVKSGSDGGSTRERHRIEIRA
jgi:hypothetical protein